jgi:hypothetical protein
MLDSDRPAWRPDGTGLYLQIIKAKTKSWSRRYRMEGSLREMGLGSSFEPRDVENVGPPEPIRENYSVLIDGLRMRCLANTNNYTNVL